MKKISEYELRQHIKAYVLDTDAVNAFPEWFQQRHDCPLPLVSKIGFRGMLHFAIAYLWLFASFGLFLIGWLAWYWHPGLWRLGCGAGLSLYMAHVYVNGFLHTTYHPINSIITADTTSELHKLIMEAQLNNDIDNQN